MKKGAAMGGEGSQGARRISSPEQLNDYLKVTNPKTWVLLVAILLLVGGLLLWSVFTTIESYATGTALADGGELTVMFHDDEKADRVEPGMELEIGGAYVEILTVGTDANGKVVATALANVPDGAYEVRVGYKTTQVISMLLN